jgi:hypothetical protein
MRNYWKKELNSPGAVKVLLDRMLSKGFTKIALAKITR